MYEKENKTSMPAPDFFKDKISIDRIRGHIKALEGPCHPVAAPEALERAADYIADCLGCLGFQMSEHRFHENGREFRNIIATRPGLSHPEKKGYGPGPFRYGRRLPRCRRQRQWWLTFLYNSYTRRHSFSIHIPL